MSNILPVFSVLAFLGSALLVAAGLTLAGWAALTGRHYVRRLSLQATGLLVFVYGTVLAGVGLVSRERVLPPGSEKYFCELDCHLAYSVGRVEPIRTAEGGSTTWALRLRTRFDERTISPRRSREAPLWPNPRQLWLVGSDGRSYRESPELTTALAEPSTPITRELKPGESYTTVLTFVLPPGVKPLKLEVAEDLLVNRLLIGHERSLFHRPVLLGLSVG